MQKIKFTRYGNVKRSETEGESTEEGNREKTLEGKVM